MPIARWSESIRDKLQQRYGILDTPKPVRADRLKTGNRKLSGKGLGKEIVGPEHAGKFKTALRHVHGGSNDREIEPLAGADIAIKNFTENAHTVRGVKELRSLPFGLD